MKRAIYCAALLLLCACAGNPQQLPVGVSICNAVETPAGFTLSATVENKSDRPISSLGVTAAFYQNFRYESFTGTTMLKQELDPGQKRDVSFDIEQAGKAGPQGQAIRCFVTHIGYLDGTSADAPPNH